MSDISQAATQDQIADSILSAPIVGDHLHGALAEKPQQESNQEALADLSTDREEWRPQNAEPDPYVAQEASRRNDSQRQPEQRQEQPQLTPEAIHESIQSLDATVREQGLNDVNSAREFATDFCAAFGSDIYKSGVDVEQMGNVMAKASYSALNAYNACQGDLSRLAPIPPESARAFSSQFLRAWGIDPREVQVNESQLAETVFRGAVNFLGTYQRFGGKVSNLDQLNTPEAAEWFFSNFVQAFGAPANVQVDRATAIKFADAGGKYILGMITKLGQAQPQRQQRAGRGRGQGRQANQFRTNADIFSPDVLERLELEKTPRGKGEDFSARQRRQASPFQSNQDIFNEGTLADYRRL